MHIVTDVRHISGYILLLTFDDGAVKVFDFEPELWGEVMQPLKDIEIFGQVEIDHGALRWPKYDIDFCPDSLYEAAVPLKRVVEAWKGAA
ncbi:MAG: DUF2442 domain-containing protein [Candidatus Eremiobacteraeota bacterium]|nr:DUF2442 domain-containing protein [Candidatus Eremiobacteraeota bacterium]